MSILSILEQATLYSNIYLKVLSCTKIYSIGINLRSLCKCIGYALDFNQITLTNKIGEVMEEKRTNYIFGSNFFLSFHFWSLNKRLARLSS